MMRCSFRRLFTLSQSKAMFLDGKGAPLPQPTATLAETLQVLAEHHHPHDNRTLVHVALARLLALDATDADSETIASFKAQTDASTDTNTPTVSSSPSSSSSHLMLQLMSSHANDVVVRERCCRCIANMCQLSTSSCATSHSGESSTAHSADNNRGNDDGDANVADVLVEQGAVELALGTLAMSSRLSAKGLAWSALAVLNLVCLSRDGAGRAARSGGESVLADVVGSVTDGAVAAGSLTTDQRVALDAMLAALARLLTAAADDNADGVRYRGERAAYGTVAAVGRALWWLSASAVREIRCPDASNNNNSSGGGGRFNASHRDGTLYFPTATPPQQAAVLAFLPPLHKAWMALKSISGCSRNLPMVYEALYISGNSGGVQTVIDAVQLFGVELEGLSAAGATEEARLQQDVLLNALDAFVDLSATRKDLGSRGLVEAVAAAAETNASKDEGGGGAEGVSAVIPTEAALVVSETLAAGVVSNIALSTIVRLHTSRGEEEESTGCSEDRRTTTTTTLTTTTTPHVYSGVVFDLFAKSLLTLANLAGHDVAVASANTLAALNVILQDANNCLSAISHRYKHLPQSDVLSTASRRELTAVAQQCALAGQVYAALWGVLRTNDGARAARELHIHETVKQLQVVLEGMYVDIKPQGEEEGKESTQPQSYETQSIAAAVATMRQLIPLGEKVLQGLQLACGEAQTAQRDQSRMGSVGACEDKL